MKRTILALAGTITLGALSAQATPTASFFDIFVDLDLNGGITISQPIVLAPGSSFTVQFQVATDAVPTIGLDYALNVTESAASGKISIIGRDNTGSVFSDYLATNAIALSGLNAVLDPSTADLGALISDTNTPLADGSYPVANLTFAVAANLAPGLYTIGAPGATLTKDDFDSTSLGVSSFQIQVVPEPGSAALLAFGLAATLGLRRRQTPSLPDAAPRSHRPRCGGRESKFLAEKPRGSL